MPYFSRLTDIVTCSITALLEAADDPQAALAVIVHEINQGIEGAKRSARTAGENARRLQTEISEQREQIAYWVSQAKAHLAAGNDDAARQDLLRKREVENLIAALEDQHRAATATEHHLTTMLHALRARLAEAERRQRGELDRPTSAPAREHGSSPVPPEIDDELETLRRSLESV
jgi:phage shock protein A